MAGTTKKWGIGCGIGCGLVLILLGGIGTCGYFGVRKVVDRVETSQQGFDELDSRYGPPKEYVPSIDGMIDAERLDTFLAVRKQTTPDRETAVGLITQLDGKSGSGAGNVLARIRAGIDFIPAMFDFIDRRNQALLEQGMGLGEYQYIYCLVYFDYLDKSLADGPGFQIGGPDDDEHQTGSVRWNLGDHDDNPDEVFERREQSMRHLLNDVLGAMARNQLEALDQRLRQDPNPDLQRWRDQLAAEVEAMEREPRRVLWERGLPARTAASIAPYAERLDAVYEPLVNVVEIEMINQE